MTITPVMRAFAVAAVLIVGGLFEAGIWAAERATLTDKLVVGAMIAAMILAGIGGALWGGRDEG